MIPNEIKMLYNLVKLIIDINSYNLYFLFINNIDNS